MFFDVNLGGKSYRIKLARNDSGWQCEVNEENVEIDAQSVSSNVVSLLIDGKSYEIRRDRMVDKWRLWVDNAAYFPEVSDPRSLASSIRIVPRDGANKITASMPGKIVRVLVKIMDQVETGQVLLVVEAMKMQNEIKAQQPGVVKRIAAEGDNVNAGDVLAIVE